MSPNRPKTPPAAPPSSEVSVVREPVAPSLPPVPAAEGMRPTATPIPRKPYTLGKASVVRKKAVAIMALRAAGYSTEQIAKELEIRPASVHTYIWRAHRAAKNGCLIDPKTGNSLLDNPVDRIEYELTNKVVDNLAKMLDSEQILERGQKSVKMEATLNMAKGVLYEKFKRTPEGVSNTLNALKIEIVMPSTGMTAARENAMGGRPIVYTDAEIEQG